MDGLFPDLLLWMRGSPVGHRSPGCPMHRMRRQMPREVQGFAQCRLSPKWVALLRERGTRNTLTRLYNRSTHKIVLT
jgi:hypothetical protein